MSQSEPRQVMCAATPEFGWKSLSQVGGVTVLIAFLGIYRTCGAARFPTSASHDHAGSEGRCEARQETQTLTYRLPGFHTRRLA